MRRALFILFAAMLAACVSTPAYVPAPGPAETGYSETQIENNRYFVTYRSRNGADVKLIEDYALLRAADITLANGREWFIVDRRTTDAPRTGESGPSIGVGVGGGNYGRSSGVGVGVGFNIPLGGGGARASAATLEIRLGDGVKPDDPNAYDARSVAMALRAQLARQ